MNQTKVPTVSELSQRIKYNLNRDFGSVWVSGEISGLKQAASGHVYLTLKDSNAQINGIIWLNNLERLKFEPRDGMEVICGGYVDVYPQRGTYQLIIRDLKPQGIGSLELARRQLEEKLRKAGLFDPALKKPLPRFPKHVAVVTSPNGAAIRDFLQVLNRRWPNIRVTIVPVAVQGAHAGREIATGVALCDHFSEKPDVIVVTRGGGSIEDLWCFNEEIVVRAVAASTIPVVSGVGHEIDVSLCDLAADVRALTPSEAAERIVPDAREISAWLSSVQQRMVLAVQRKLTRATEQLEALASRTVLTQPHDRIHQLAVELDHLESRMSKAVGRQLEQAENQVKNYAAKLETLSPLSVLARGYSVTSTLNGETVTSHNQVTVGDSIKTRLREGFVISRIEASDSESN